MVVGLDFFFLVYFLINETCENFLVIRPDVQTATDLQPLVKPNTKVQINGVKSFYFSTFIRLDISIARI